MAELFLLTPLREGRQALNKRHNDLWADFYSRPCGRGDIIARIKPGNSNISTHAPAGGATRRCGAARRGLDTFLLTPLREGRPQWARTTSRRSSTFLLTPLREGRRLPPAFFALGKGEFLLTPLREGRHELFSISNSHRTKISTHAPAGGATLHQLRLGAGNEEDFYSRPCGRGDTESGV